MKNEDIVIVQRAYRVAALRFIVSAVGGELRRRAEAKPGVRSLDQPTELHLPEEPLVRMVKRRAQSTAIGLATGGFLSVTLPAQATAALLVTASVGSLLGDEFHHRNWTTAKTRALANCVQSELKEVGASLNRLVEITDGHLTDVGDSALKAGRDATESLREAFDQRAKLNERQADDLAVDLKTFVEDYEGPLKTIEQWPHLKASDLRAVTDTTHLSL